MNTRKVISIFIFLQILVIGYVYPQKLWDLGYPAIDYEIIGSDSTISHLEGLILSKNSTWYEYDAAARWLAYYHGATEKQFLLENLNIRISEGHKFGVGRLDSSWQWRKYFADQEIRGYLGDQSAIAGMDTVARFFPEEKDFRRLQAIKYLADLGHYDYYDIIKSQYPDRYSALGLYGKDARYRNEVRSVLENVIMNDSTNRGVRVDAANAMSFFDKPYVLNLLGEIFHKLSGKERYFLFLDLNQRDPDGAPERTVEAVRKEPDGMERSEYFPTPGEVERGMVTKRYYEPWFIKFTRDWLDKDTSKEVQYFAGWWLSSFVPLKPDSTLSVLTQIDNLLKLKDTVANYQWIGGNTFVTELTTYLQDARKYYMSNNLVNCSREILKFRKRIYDEHNDALNVTPDFITEEGAKYLYTASKYIKQCLPQIPPDPEMGSISPINIYAGSSAFILTVNGKNFVSGSTVNWNKMAKTTTFIADSILQANILANDIAVIDSPLVQVKNPDGGESNSIRFYIRQAPVISGCNVKLVNSADIKLTGGTLQYYDGSWKDAINNNDGTFFVNTAKTSLSLRMTYEYGTQTKSNVAVGSDTIAFQTVNAQIQLQNSGGALIDTGMVQYYAGAWRSFGTTINGIATKDLLPNTYSFRMTYAYASKDKQQDIGTNSIVVFQTVNTSVQLQNSQGNLIDQGTVQYYSGAWRAFGTTNNGTTNKELLPNNYSFRMTYAYASKDKQQDLNTNPTVVFQTVNAAVQLQNSQGTLIDQGTVQYYSGAWRTLGTTANGVATKDLLPNTYSFRMTYEYASIDKQQDISTNSIVSFSTVLCTIRAKNSQNELIDGATISYYSGAWRLIGLTVNGEITKELLPLNLSFRAKYGTKQNDKQQNLSTNNIVEFVIP